MSRSLERLREMFGDPLLIRSGRAYERTVRGDTLLRELQSLLPRLESMVRGTGFRSAEKPGTISISGKGPCIGNADTAFDQENADRGARRKIGSIAVGGTSLRRCDRGEVGRFLQRGASALRPTK